MRYLILISILLITKFSYSQEEGKKGQKVTLKQADELEGGVFEGKKIRKLRGNVIFTQDDMTLYCDSAYHYIEKNNIDAFGHVKIVQGDMTTTGEKLRYNGDEKIAKMKNNVVMKDSKMTLYTDHLDYNMNTKVGYYYNGGKIIDRKNTLVSRSGRYNTVTKMLYFKNQVNLKNPEYELWCDTLNYHTTSEIAYFVGPTDIESKGTKLFARKGIYNTILGESHFEDQAAINDTNYRLSGDSLFYDEKKKIGFAFDNVELYLKKENIKIYGDIGMTNDSTGISKMYGGNPLMKNLMKGDTLYLSADTLIAISDTNDNIKKLLAFNNVKMFKSDLQATCDSLTYNYQDSTIYFNYSPIIWSDENQMTGQKVKIQLANDEIDKMYIDEDAFVVSEDSFINYNQIKGKNMIAHFTKGEIKKLDVEGNGQSIYFVLEDDTLFTGMNKTICTNMVFYFDSSEVKKINFLTDPEARFIPPNELSDPDKKLTGFDWLIEMRPELEELLSPTKSSNSLLLKVPEESELPEESTDNQEHNLINREDN